MEKPFRHIALGVVRYNRKVLVIRRHELEEGQNGESLTWVFPGGEIKKGETPVESIEREFYEETGYRVKAKETIDKRNHPAFPVFVHYIACELADTERDDVMESGIAEMKWVSPAEFANIITSSLNPKVKDYLQID